MIYGGVDAWHSDARVRRAGIGLEPYRLFSITPVSLVVNLFQLHDKVRDVL